MTSRVCNICLISIPDTDYRASCGNICRSCRNARSRQWRKDNKDKSIASKRKYNHNNVDRVKDSTREYQSKQKYKDYARNLRLKKLYGIDTSQYNEMLKLQDNKCAICLAPQEVYNNRFAVDHSHISGKVRGLLCFICNRNICGNIDKRAKSKHVTMTEVSFVERLLEYYKKAQ